MKSGQVKSDTFRPLFGHFSDMFGLCLGYISDMFGYWADILGICSAFCCGHFPSFLIFRKCSDMFGIILGHVLNMTGTILGQIRDPKIRKKIVVFARIFDPDLGDVLHDKTCFLMAV